MSNNENHDGEENGMCDCMCGSMKKDFKLAMLEKKEKILKAKLEFVGKMKEVVSKIPDNKE